MLRVAREPKIACDIAITIFEYEDRCLVDFDGEIRVSWILADGMIYIGFFSRWYTPIDFFDQTLVDQLVKY